MSRQQQREGDGVVGKKKEEARIVLMCGFNLVNKHEKIEQKSCICARSQARDTYLFICCLFYTDTHSQRHFCL